MTLDVVNLAPTDEKRATCLQLGMARFASLEALLDPQVKPYLLHYKRAFFVCFAVIAAIVALSFLIPLLKTA